MRPWVIFIISVTLLMSCTHQTESSGAKAGKQERIHPKVIVTSVKSEIIQETKTVYGQTRPFKAVDVFSKVNGLVIRKKHQIGDHVQKGQVLAVVRQDIPGMEFADHEVKATMNGTIVQDFCEKGQTVTVQKPLFQLAQIDPILIEVKIPEEWLSHINLKKAVKITFESLPQKQFLAQIYRVLPQLDSRSRSAIVQLTMPNPKHDFAIGMFAQAMLTGTKRNVLSIPVDALVRSGLEYFVFTIEQNVAHKQLIQPGEIFDERLEVVKGLSEGMQIVVFGQNLLNDGMKVEVEKIQ